MDMTRGRARRSQTRHCQGRTKSSIPFSSWMCWLVCLGALLLSEPKASRSSSFYAHAMEWSCDLLADTCPTRDDGRCDNEIGGTGSCPDADCKDCAVMCEQFINDCDECLLHGCYWCPKEGLCSNSDRHVYSDILAYSQQCDRMEAWTQESCSAPGEPFNDPLFVAQSWAFDAINLRDAWEQGYTGNGVRVRVNDGGIDPDHAEFEGRFDEAASCPNFRWNPTDAAAYHGTAVASIIAAGGNNSICGVGVAPGVTISSCRSLDDPPAGLASKQLLTDVVQNSYGYDACRRDSRNRRQVQEQQCPFVMNPSFNPCVACGDFSTLNFSCRRVISRHCYEFFDDDTEACLEFLDAILDDGRCTYNRLSAAEQKALVSGIRDGRDGKGLVFVWASGNTHRSGDDTNFQGYLNSRLTIAVGSIGQSGYRAPYSVTGSALFVSAPGGEEGHPIHVVSADPGTTDQCYTKDLWGTSFSCPFVSGVAALMLEARPDLSWRDVQGILATTSRMVVEAEDNTRQINAAGITHSNSYGFGVVDAGAAVRTAETWELYGQEELLVGESPLLNSPISDAPDTILSSSISIEAVDAENFQAESVVVYLKMQHFSRGDLKVTLLSPDGTPSVLTPGNRPENTQLDEDEEWKLLSVRHWGEMAAGFWSLSITDSRPGDAAPCADSTWTTTVGDTPITCGDLEDKFYCSDGEVLEGVPLDTLRIVHQGETAIQGCCACGGGILRSQVEDQIERWRIVIYGQSIRPFDNTTISPSPSPSRGPVTTTNGPPAFSFPQESEANTAVASIAFGWTMLAGVALLPF